ncbi:type II toxin-antitoxin system ParD family antitoxin [Marinicella sp. W31]|uniref:ribbon-helix-helix domain-containing protein n=1 Tax=Marinicella sp. W31 TaxID=3023713 RepID=UPI003756C9A0
MARTITVDIGEELKSFIEGMVASGQYKTNSKVAREGLRRFHKHLPIQCSTMWY